MAFWGVWYLLKEAPSVIYGTPKPTKKNVKKKKVLPQRHLAVKYGTTRKNSLFLPQNAQIFFAYSSVREKRTQTTQTETKPHVTCYSNTKTTYFST
jgi:hypothetical protein